MIRETIQNVVANITETCMNEDVYVTDEESIHLPSRGAIIGIIKDLRRVVFQGISGMRIYPAPCRDISLAIC